LIVLSLFWTVVFRQKNLDFFYIITLQSPSSVSVPLLPSSPPSLTSPTSPTRVPNLTSNSVHTFFTDQKYLFQKIWIFFILMQILFFETEVNSWFVHI
jgi:hypothetical protein